MENKCYIVNAFSINMVKDFPVNIEIERFGESSTISDLAKEYIRTGNAKSCIGHKVTADILELPLNRETVTVNSGDYLLLAQYIGERLPEGTTILPEGSKIEWFGIKIGA